MTKHSGSCHCGAIRYEVELDLEGGSKCNCTICTKLGAMGKIVKPSAFRVVAGDEADMGQYVWGHKVSTRYFCKTCGVYCYGRGSMEVLGGDYVSVNMNTLDGVDVGALAIVHWDGRHDNWQAGPRPTPYPIHAASAA